MYRMIVEGNVSKGDVEELRREGILQENNKGGNRVCISFFKIRGCSTYCQKE